MLGNVTIDSGVGTATRLTAKDVNGLTFKSPSTCTIKTISGTPFGNVTANTLPVGFTDLTTGGSIVFDTGATFNQQSGLDPFTSTTNPVAKFLSGSTYIYTSGTFASTGQTYGNLQLLLSATVANAPSMTVLNNLTVGNGTVSGVAVALNTASGSAGTAGVSIGGNISVSTPTGAASPNTLSFAPASASGVALNGTAAQSINGTAPGFGANAFLILNNTFTNAANTGGVTLNVPITVPAGITFTAGVLNTTATNILTLPAVATVTAASGTDNVTVTNTSFVNGPVARATPGAGTFTVNPATGTGLFFPVGTPGKYRPIAFSLTQTSAAGTTYTGSVTLRRTPVQAFPAATTTSIKRVSGRRYYTITPTVVPTFTNGQISLYYGLDDEVDAPSLLRIAKSQSTGTWANLGGGQGTSATDGVGFRSGSITSATAADATNAPNAPFSALSNFALASTTAASNTGNNPLPVELTRFLAAARSGGVILSWTTASEKNSAYFEVQRSAIGTAFEALGTVRGQGNSTSTHEYAWEDSRPLSGVAYYRLRQVDADGTVTFSPVLTVKPLNTGDFAVYPNPSTGNITLPAALGAVHYRVLNVLGQVLLSGQADGNDHIDLTHLAKGTFFLELTGETGRTIQRLIRQ